MRLSRIAAGLAGVSLLMSATIAQAAPAVRDASPVAEASNMGDGDNTWIWIGLAILVGIGLILILDDDDEEEPQSP